MEACMTLGCPDVIRIAEIDPCAATTVTGNGAGMVLRCQRNVTIEPRNRDAETSEFVSDCGIPFEYTQDSILQGYTLSFESLRISPELHAKLMGYELLQIDGTNVGFIEEAVAGCAAPIVKPTFVVEAFFRNVACTAPGDPRYLRRIIPGVKFSAEQDKEGQLVFERFTGTSYPTLAAGLINPLSDTAGPWQDVPEDIYTDLAALPAGYQTTGLRFADPIADPVPAGLVAGTCYSANVPVDVAP